MLKQVVFFQNSDALFLRGFSSKHKSGVALAAFLLSSTFASVVLADPVPGYYPPVTYATAPDYADDTRGVFVPSHGQQRLRSERELASYGQESLYVRASARSSAPAGGDLSHDLDRIAGRSVSDGPSSFPQVASAERYGSSSQGGASAPIGRGAGFSGSARDGVEVAVARPSVARLDMEHSVVRLKEDRITIRRALQSMMDQVGGRDWVVVWDLSGKNMSLPDTEISIAAEEPFTNVLNALLARMQTKCATPLRVVRYDSTKRLVVTDKVAQSAGSSAMAGGGSVGGGRSTVAASQPVITEQVLRETSVSLHYDEIPLVEALENIVNQAGKGEWRLRVYAGSDQVLRPAHVEEPFSTAMERLLKLFNLKYEIFPGGKLIVITQNNRLGFRGM